MASYVGKVPNPCEWCCYTGYYWIDPNEGCIDDAEYIYCDFENKRACVDPKKENVSQVSKTVLTLLDPFGHTNNCQQ